MSTAAAPVLVLTYHSISDAAGPTSIPREVFRRQLDVLKALDYGSMSVDEFLAWRRGEAAPGRKVLITFDDGFTDFADTAFPLLQERGLSALVFVPTAKLGTSEDWSEGLGRPLMGWGQVEALAKAGIEFGAHGLHHADLTRLPAEARRAEIVRSGLELAERLGRRTRSFAAPYGHMDAQVRAEVAGAYEVAFGTRLDRARRDDDPFAVPRVDMHYFRDPRSWRGFLAGDELYFLARRGLRAVRGAGMRLLGSG